MDTVIPAMIRKRKSVVQQERKELKMKWKSELAERGDIAHIHKLMNEFSEISYQSVSKAINPEDTYWSSRVAEFVTKYLEVRSKHESSHDPATNKEY